MDDCVYALMLSFTCAEEIFLLSMRCSMYRLTKTAYSSLVRWHRMVGKTVQYIHTTHTRDGLMVEKSSSALQRNVNTTFQLQVKTLYERCKGTAETAHIANERSEQFALFVSPWFQAETEQPDLQNYSAII